MDFNDNSLVFINEEEREFNLKETPFIKLEDIYTNLNNNKNIILNLNNNLEEFENKNNLLEEKIFEDKNKIIYIGLKNIDLEIININISILKNYININKLSLDEVNFDYEKIINIIDNNYEKFDKEFISLYEEYIKNYKEAHEKDNLETLIIINKKLYEIVINLKYCPLISDLIYYIDKINKNIKYKKLINDTKNNYEIEIYKLISNIKNNIIEKMEKSLEIYINNKTFEKILLLENNLNDIKNYLVNKIKKIEDLNINCNINNKDYNINNNCNIGFNEYKNLEEILDSLNIFLSVSNNNIKELSLIKNKYFYMNYYKKSFNYIKNIENMFKILIINK